MKTDTKLKKYLIQSEWVVSYDIIKSYAYYETLEDLLKVYKKKINRNETIAYIGLSPMFIKILNNKSEMIENKKITDFFSSQGVDSVFEFNTNIKE